MKVAVQRLETRAGRGGFAHARRGGANRVHVAVDADQRAGGQPLRDFGRMSAAAQRAVHVYAVRADVQPA